jgi:hypothetical protein
MKNTSLDCRVEDLVRRLVVVEREGDREQVVEEVLASLRTPARGKTIKVGDDSDPKAPRRGRPPTRGPRRSE